MPRPVKSNSRRVTPAELKARKPISFTSRDGARYWRTPSGEIIRQHGLHEGFPGGEKARVKFEEAVNKLYQQTSRPKPQSSARVFTPPELSVARNKVQGLLNQRAGMIAEGDYEFQRGLRMQTEIDMDAYNRLREKWGLKPVKLDIVLKLGLPSDEVQINPDNPESNQRSKKSETEKEWGRIRDSYRAAMRNARKRTTTPPAPPLKANELEWVRAQLVHVIRLRVQKISGNQPPVKKTIASKRERAPSTPTQPPMNAQILEARFYQRFRELPASAQRNAMTLLRVGQQLLQLESKVRKKGNFGLAARCVRDYETALDAFVNLLRKA